MKLSIAQITHGMTKKDSLNKMIKMLDDHGKNNDLIIFPETCMGLKTETRSLADMAENVETGDFAVALRTAAKRNNVNVCACLWEISGEKRVYNTAVVYGSDGELKAQYRKIHLFDALSVKESDDMLAGDAVPQVFDLCGIKCSLAVCYDLRFPEVFRSAALRGAQLFIVPAAWYAGEYKKEHLRNLSMTRALENTSYCAVADICGGTFVGHSAIFDPYGKCIAETLETEAVVSAEISTEKVADVREKLPCLDNLVKNLFYE